MKTLQSYLANQFALAGILFVILLGAIMIADYVRNGAGIKELGRMIRRDKGSFLFTMFALYAICELLVSLVALGLNAILHA